MNVLDRQAQLNELERIEKLPQAQKWLALRKLMWTMNPQNRIDDQLHCAEVARRRREDGLNQLGSSKGGHMRAIVSLPEYLWLAIKAADPEFHQASNSKDKSEIRKLQRRLWSTFSEYRLAEKF